jgi:two-component system NarL family sensor kinase
MFRRKLSIKDKLIMYLVFLSGFAIFIVSFVSYLMAKEALMERTFNQLTSIKTVKNRQLNNFFQSRIHDINIVKNIIIKFNAISNSGINNYSKDFLINFLKINSNTYQNALILEGSKILPVLNLNEEIPPIKPQLQTQFVNEMQSEIYFTDFIEKYQSNQFSFYIGTELSDNNETILLFEISADVINKMMLENNENNGLGSSGETYLVGDDYLMRSSSKFHNNSILKTEVKTIGVDRVWNGKYDEDIFPDYRGIEVLSSYTKANIPFFEWALMVELDKKEAIAPIIAIRNYEMFVTLFITLLVLIIAIIISKKFSKPIIELKEAATLIGEGNLDIQLKQTTSDEIGELTVAFNQMAENLKLKNEQLESEKNIRYSLILDTQEKERERLSRELHDNLGQLFTALKLNLENYKEYATEHKDYIDKSITLVDTAIDDIRRISNDLMPSILKEFGLLYAIENLKSNLEKQSSFNINMLIDESIIIDDRKNSVYIFRIIQEAVNNSIKHSNASDINVTMQKKADIIYLKIEDNGIGFDTKTITFGNGLFNIKERVRAINGEIAIESSANEGTKIIIKIPETQKELKSGMLNG